MVAWQPSESGSLHSQGHLTSAPFSRPSDHSGLGRPSALFSLEGMQPYQVQRPHDGPSSQTLLPAQRPNAFSFRSFIPKYPLCARHCVDPENTILIKTVFVPFLLGRDSVMMSLRYHGWLGEGGGGWGRLLFDVALEILLNASFLMSITCFHLPLPLIMVIFKIYGALPWPDLHAKHFKGIMSFFFIF